MGKSDNTNSRGWLGSVTTIIVAVALVALFWGPAWLVHWDTMFFSTDGEDLVKDVYTTSYHVAYDDGMAISHAMNYPYGEYYIFTGLHPLIAAPLQWLRDAGVAHTSTRCLIGKVSVNDSIFKRAVCPLNAMPQRIRVLNNKADKAIFRECVPKRIDWDYLLITSKLCKVIVAIIVSRQHNACLNLFKI